MRVLILMGSPRLNGNTAELCRYFMEELKTLGADMKYLELDRLTISRMSPALTSILVVPEVRDVPPYAVEVIS